MDFKEQASEFLERNLYRIVGYAGRFGVADPACIDLLVGGVWHRTARAARPCITDTGGGLESTLHSPGTAVREDGLFRAFGCFFWYELK